MAAVPLVLAPEPQQVVVKVFVELLESLGRAEAMVDIAIAASVAHDQLVILL